MTPQRNAHRPNHARAHAHAGHPTHEDASPPPQIAPSILRRWMRRWRGAEPEPRRPLSEQRRLLAIRRLIVVDLGPHSATLTQRDHRLYARLISAPNLSDLHRLRFDLFDLLCRQIGEGAATVRLHEIDIWLSPRT
jgi:hypothetical protein